MPQTNIPFSLREHRLLAQRAPETRPPAPEAPRDDAAARSIIESTRTAVDALDLQRQMAEQRIGKERIEHLQRVRGELDKLHAQIDTNTAAPEAQVLRGRIDALQTDVAGRIAHLLQLEENSVYRAGQTLLRSPVGGPLKGISGMLTNIGTFLKETLALLTPLWDSIMKPIRGLGPKTTGLLASIVGAINPVWGNALRGAVEQQPAAQDDMDVLFRTFLTKGRTLEPSDRATKQDLDTLRFIRAAAEKQGYTQPGFAQGVLTLVPGTGPVTYAQLADAAKKLPLDSRVASSSTTPAAPRTP